MKIAILIYEGLTALDAIGPYEVLSRFPDAEVHFVGRERGTIRTDSNFLELRIDTAIGDLPNPDIILVPGSTGGMLHVMRQQDVLAWLQKAHETSRLTTSVCTGSFILGAAGLLKGIPATTHWLSIDMLENFGAEPRRERIVQAGRVITAAGVSAGIDMALHMAEQIYDETLAQALQLAIEYDPSPKSPMADPLDGSSPVVQRSTEILRKGFNEWMRAHPLED